MLTKVEWRQWIISIIFTFVGKYNRPQSVYSCTQTYTMNTENRMCWECIFYSILENTTCILYNRPAQKKLNICRPISIKSSDRAFAFAMGVLYRARLGLQPNFPIPSYLSYQMAVRWNRMKLKFSNPINFYPTRDFWWWLTRIRM